MMLKLFLKIKTAKHQQNITITLFLRAAWSIMALVKVLKPDRVIVGPSRRRGLTGPSDTKYVYVLDEI